MFIFSKGHLCLSKGGGACAMTQWHNCQSKYDKLFNVTVKHCSCGSNKRCGITLTMYHTIHDVELSTQSTQQQIQASTTFHWTHGTLHLLYRLITLCPFSVV